MEKTKSILAMEKNFNLETIEPVSKLMLYRFVSLIEQINQSISSFCSSIGISSLPFLNLLTEKDITNFPIELLPAICTGLGISVRDFFDFPPYNEVEK